MVTDLILTEAVSLVLRAFAVAGVVVALVYAFIEYRVGRDDVRFTQTDPAAQTAARANVTRAVGLAVLGITDLALCTILTYRVLVGPQTNTQLTGAIALFIQATGLLLVVIGERRARRRIGELHVDPHRDV